MSIWTEVSENVWVTEHSTLSVARSPRTLPGDCPVPYEDVEWTEEHDREGDLTQWKAEVGRFTFIIFND